MKKLRWVIYPIVLVIAMLLGLFIYDNKEYIDEVKKMTWYLGDEIYVEEESDGFLLSDVEELGINLGEKFTIELDEERDETYIRENLTLNPTFKHEIEKVDKYTVNILPQEILRANKLYNVSIDDKKWAFQSKDAFIAERSSVRSDVPLPINGGVEIYLNKEMHPRAVRYKIEPAVDMKYETQWRRIIFYPKQTFKHNTEYKLTLFKESKSVSGNLQLEEDFVVNFKTSDIMLPKKVERPDRLVFANQIGGYKFKEEEVPYMFLSPTIWGETNIKNLDFEVYKIYDIEKLVGNMRDVNKRIEDSVKGEPIIKFNAPVEKHSKHEYGVRFPEALDKGAYIIKSIQKEGDPDFEVVQVTDLGVYSLRTETKTLTWFTDVGEKKVLAKEEVTLFDGVTYKTDKSGIVISKPYKEKESTNWKDIRYLKYKDETYIEYYSNTYGYYDDYYRGFYFWWNQNLLADNDYYGYMHFDRNIYLPNDEIKVWGFVRPKDFSKLEESKYKVVIIYARNDEVLLENDVNFIDDHSFESSIKIRDFEAGIYIIKIKDGENLILARSMEVAEFKPINAKIEVADHRKTIFAWDKEEITAAFSRLDGSPLREEKISYDYKDRVTDEKGEVTVIEGGMAGEPTWNRLWYRERSMFRAVTDNYANVEKGIAINLFYKDELLDIERNKIDSLNYEYNIETNKIDLTEVEDKLYFKYDEIKGKNIDKEVEVDIKEIQYYEEKTGSYYDYKEKISRDIYDFKKREIPVNNEKINTVDGKATFNYTFKPNKRYELTFSMKPNKGEVTEIEYYVYTYDTNYPRWYYGENSTGSSTSPYFTVEEDNDNLKKGETTGLTYFDLDHKEDNKYLYIYMQNGIINYKVVDKPLSDIEFENKFAPNIYIRTIQFTNGGFRINRRNVELRYNYEDEELVIEAETDKDFYEPGDEVEITLNVHDKDNNPVKANVNISIVDEAVFNVKDQVVKVLNEIYTNYYSSGMLYEYFRRFKSENEQSEGAERGGGGGESHLDFGAARDDFKLTALFKSGTTDENGNFETNFTLPDNLTSWRITSQAITDSIKAGVTTNNIISRLNFDVEVMMNEYMTDKDEAEVLLKFSGYSYSKDIRKAYTLAVIDENEEVVITKKGSIVGSFANVPIGKLDLGRYKIYAKANQEGYEDSVIREIEVVKTNFKTEITDYYDSKGENMEFNNESINKYLLINEMPYLKMLCKYAYSYTNRIDTAMAKNYVRELINEIHNENYFETKDMDLSLYEDTQSGGYAELPYSAADPKITADLIVAKVIEEREFRYSNVGKYLYSFAEKSRREDDVVSAYMGLGAMGEPVLNELKYLAKIDDLKDYNKMKVILGLLEIGDREEAKKVYLKLKKKKYKKINRDEGYYKDNQAMAYAMIIEERLGIGDEDKLYTYLIEVEDKYSEYSIEKLMYLKGKAEKEVVAGKDLKITYTVGEKEETVELMPNECLYIKAKNEKVNFINANKSYTVAHTYRKNVELIDEASEYVTIEKTIENKDNIKQGDSVRISYKVTFDENAPSGFYKLSDVVPSGFSDPELSDYYLNNYGRVVEKGFYYNKRWTWSNKNKTFSYKVNAINKGKYYVNRGLLKHSKSNLKVTTNEDYVEIK